VDMEDETAKEDTEPQADTAETPTSSTKRKRVTKPKAAGPKKKRKFT